MPSRRGSIIDLLQAGRLSEGEELVINTRRHGRVLAHVQADGSIKLSDGSVHRSPSAAAKRAAGVGGVDGWLRWRVPRLGNIAIDELRAPT